MPSSRSQRCVYAKISLQKRQSLVRLVFQKHLSIAKAGRRLSIKPSTAKLIVKRYRQTGQFFVKKGPKYGQSQSESSSLCSSVAQEVENQENAGQVQTQNMVQQNGTNLNCIYYPSMSEITQCYYYPTALQNNFLFFYY